MPSAASTPGSPSDQRPLTLIEGDSLAQFTSTLAPRRLDVAGLSLLQYPASEVAAGLANLWLRVDGESVPLLGPDSQGETLTGHGIVGRRGVAAGVSWQVGFHLVGGEHPGWRWTIDLRNTRQDPATVSVVVAHDVALAPYDVVRVNEYYTSQYLDVSPVVDDDFGTAIAVRQNMPGARVPWVGIASLDQGEEWATDAIQLVRQTAQGPRLDATDLPSERWQHEHTLAVLGSSDHELAADQQWTTGFVAVVVADHPAATGPADAERIRRVRQLSAQLPPMTPLAQASAATPFSDAVINGAEPTPEQLGRWFGTERELVELGPDDRPWAFNTAQGHVVLASKQSAVLRPHGHILRTGSALRPETDVLTSTIWMDGVFTSQLTVGHVTHHRLLSGVRTYLGLQSAHGLRVLIEVGGRWRLLNHPSAWQVSQHTARWLYLVDGRTVEVSTHAHVDEHRLSLQVNTPDPSTRVLVAAHLALGEDDGQTPEVDDTAAAHRPVEGTTITVRGQERSLSIDAGQTELTDVGGDELLFADGVGRGEPWLCLVASGQVSLSLRARDEANVESVGEGTVDVASGLDQPAIWQEWRDRLRLVGGADQRLSGEVACVDAQLPWFQQNAMIHYLSPRGLEQFSGGAWGTRDVCQGPVGLLTAMGRDDAVRDVLLRIFAGQRPAGDWPQAFDFLPTSGPANTQPSHGDVVHWPLLALGDYLIATGDASILDEPVTSRDDTRTMRDRVRAALAHIDAVAIVGSPLPAYGHGDWNDSLQPADPHLAQNMVSTWTTTLKTHMLHRLAEGLAEADTDPDLADHLRDLAAATHTAMVGHLLADGELAGYGVVGDGGVTAGLELLVHPRDQRTGLSHGVLPWIHAISGDQLSPEQARHHLDLIEQHLLGPDGARLFNTPPAYRGGPMEVFQRAEAATFWGREIGLMYTHAHLRYCEALARVGRADQLFDALLLTVPIGLPERSERSQPRQSTCYYSSSDGAFKDRAQAGDHYDDLIAGKVDLEGGWRIYSSGPGLFLRLLVETVLGVRRRSHVVELDPVLPQGLDGLSATVPFEDGAIEVRYRFVDADWQRSDQHTPVTAVLVDGQPVTTTALHNPYRDAGVSIDRGQLRAGAVIDVQLGKA